MGKTAIFNAIKSGRLSASRDEKGQYQIDPAELHRVFLPIHSEQDEGQDRTVEDSLENAYLREKIQLLESQIERERQQADHWREQAERMTLLLTHQPPASLTEAPQIPPARPSLWQRLTGKG